MTKIHRHNGDRGDIPKHRRKRGPRKWKVEVIWRDPWPWEDPDAWCWGGKYATERAAIQGFEHHKRERSAFRKKLRYRAVRLVDPDGEVHSRWEAPNE